MAIPDTSPLTSAMNTRTPSRENPSAMSISETVLPLPVAPATMPWRLPYFASSETGLSPLPRRMSLISLLAYSVEAKKPKEATDEEALARSDSEFPVHGSRHVVQRPASGARRCADGGRPAAHIRGDESSDAEPDTVCGHVLCSVPEQHVSRNRRLPGSAGGQREVRPLTPTARPSHDGCADKSIGVAVAD